MSGVLAGCENVVIMSGYLGISVMVSQRKRRIIYLVTKPSWLAYSCDDSERYIADGVDGLLAAYVSQIIRKSVGARHTYMKEYDRYLLAGRCVEDPEALESIEPGSAAYVLRAPQLCGNNWLVLDTGCVYRYLRFRLEREGKRYVVPAQLALCGGNQDVIPCIANTMRDWLAIMIPKHSSEELEERLGCWRVNREKKYYKVCWRRIPEDKLVPAP